MNARKTIALFALLGLLIAGTATAAPVGTAKARGDYRPFWQSQGWSGSQARRSTGRSYAYRAPAMRSAPTTVTAQPEIVAQAPAEGRRFSYAPTTEGAVSTTPCPPTGAVPQTGRRFSYAPAEATVAPTVSAPRAYNGGSGYSRSRSGSASKELWALPKTDPRKFNSR